MLSGKRLVGLAMFTRQLYVLTACGTPVADALLALERQSKDEHLQHTIRSLRQSVEQGTSLSAAMERCPQYFDPVCRTLIAVGESSGTLDKMLERISRLMQQRVRMRKSLVGALIYPTLVTSAALGAVFLILLIVLPRFEDMFSALDVPLPSLTIGLLFVGDVFRQWWWIALLALAGLVVGVMLGLRNPTIRFGIHGLCLRIPIVGPVVRQFTMARFTRILGLLMEAKVPLVESLRMTANSMANVHYKELILKAERIVERGSALSEALEDSPLIAVNVNEAIRSGEESGQLEEMLLHMADFLEEDNESTIRSLTSMIEPFLLLGLGILIGTIAVSLFLPLFDLTASV